MRILFAVVVISLMVFQAKAARFSVIKSDQQSLVIFMEGEIKFGDPARLQRIVGRDQFAADRVIFLNSEGGLVQPALELGLVVRAYGLTTVIADNARCLSACSMVFVGGRTTNGVSPSRVLFKGGKLGVHRPFLKSTGGVDPEVMRQVRAYFNYMDAGQKFYRLTAATPSSTMRLIKNAELKAMGDYRIMDLTKTNKPSKPKKFQKPRVQPKVYARKRSRRDLEIWRRSFLENID